MHFRILLLRMKPLAVLLFLFICCLTTATRAQMRQVYVDPDQGNQITKLDLYSPSEGYVAFGYWIGYTADSGRTFVKKYITTSNVDYNGYLINYPGFDIRGVKAFNKDTLIAYGDFGFVPSILYSTNGGNTFKLVFYSLLGQMNQGITDMAFSADGNTGFAVDEERVVMTTNRGRTWAEVVRAPGEYLTGVEVRGQTIYAYSKNNNSRNLYVSRNNGSTWDRLTLPTGTLRTLSFITAAKGWVNIENDSDGRLYYTTNGGSSWRQINTSGVTSFRCEKMKFINDSTGYAIGGGFYMAKTIDSGKVWEILPRDNDFSYLNYGHEDIQCIGNTQVWAGGGHGFLELSTNAGGTTIPAAYFAIDTTGFSQTDVVNLRNYSKPGYQYQWLKNGTLIGSSYHSSYVRDNIFKLRDTIQLIVSNGGRSDTAMKWVDFNPTPLISSFAPVAGGQGTIVMIKGVNFSDVQDVSFGGVPAAIFSVISDTLIRAVVANGASGTVRVRTPYAGGARNAFTFYYPPDITSFTPTSGAAGDTITITGTQFTATTNVLFGGIPAASFSVISDTQIKAVLGKGTSGKITVYSGGGVDSLDGFKTVPVISSFTPQRGTTASVITITGTGLDLVTSVSVGGVPVRSFVIDSVTGITAVIGAGNTGSVKVANANGEFSLPGFTFILPPVITNVSTYKASAGSTVTITGTNFSSTPAGNIVYFGAMRGTVTAASATSLSVTVPAGATYSPVSVTTNELTAYSRLPFSPTFSGGGSITAGSFTSRTDYLAGPDPTYCLDGGIADVNNDGLSEMIIGNSSPDNIAVWKNNSSGGNLAFSDTRYTLGEQPIYTAINDLDGDGLPDIMSANNGATVSILRNTSTSGAVSFADKVLVNGNYVGIADLDLDGKPDLVTGTYVYRNISYPGKLAFTDKTDVAGGRAILAADLDQDGKPDLVLLGGDRMLVARNTSTTGNISFDAPVNYSVNSTNAVAAGDLDGDNKLDLAALSPNGLLSIFRNTGSQGAISFAPQADFRISGPVTLAINDLDGDGKADVAVGAQGTGKQLSIFRNTSKPGSIALAPKVDFTLPFYPQDIAIGDLNGDGRSDILVIQTGYTFSVFKNQVTPAPFVGSFTPKLAEQGTTITITGNNFSGTTAVSFGAVAAASFTVHNDTLITAVTGAGASGNVGVTNSYGTGTRPGFVFGQPPVVTSFSPASGGPGTQITISGHHFGASAQDNIVHFGGVKATVVSATTNSITVKVPTGSTYAPLSVTTNGRTGYASRPFRITFTTVDTVLTSSSFAATGLFNGANSGCIVDLDGDGKLEIVHGWAKNNIGVQRNTSVPGKPSFAPAVEFDGGGTPKDVIKAADLNGDGKQDLVIMNGEYSISVLLNTSTAGNISFAARIEQVFPTKTSMDIAINDLDADGLPDIVVSSYGSLMFAVFRNISSNGNFALAERVDYSLGFNPYSVISTDLDADGQAEIVAAGWDGLAVFRNISIPGSIQLAQPVQYTVSSTASVSADDFDADGKPDLVVTDFRNNAVSVMKNKSTTGKIEFAPAQLFSWSQPTYSARIADFNGDNRPDIVSSKMALLQNAGTNGNLAMRPAFDLPGGGAGAPSGTDAAIGDMDGDGIQDIVAFGHHWTITIFVNQSDKKPIRICTGMDTALTTSLTGSHYQWQRNTGQGFAAITDNDIFSGSNTATLRLHNVPLTVNGDSYRCIVDNNTDTTYALNVKDGPGVTISASAAQICDGTAVTFTATPVYQETTPSYQWLVNGVTAGSNSYQHTSSSLKNGDAVTVKMTSDAACGTSIAISDTITMGVTVLPKPELSVNTFMLNVVTNYEDGITYTWQLLDGLTGWQDVVPAANDKSFVATNRGTYRVVVRKGDCTAVSQQQAMVITALPSDPDAPGSVHLYPNPVDEQLNLDALKLTDKWETLDIMSIDGSQCIATFNIAGKTKVTLQAGHLNSGYYLAVLRRKNGPPAIMRFIKL